MKRLFVLLLFSSFSAQADCLTYSGEVTLRGTLVRHTFPEQPNYESIAKGDAKATYFFVSPHEPFCVAEGNDSYGADEPAEPQVKKVQLVFLDGKKSYRQLRPSLTKEVMCRGGLYHAISGHHHSPVLLYDARCSPTHPSSGTLR